MPLFSPGPLQGGSGVFCFVALTCLDPAREGLSGLSPTFDPSLPQSDGLFTGNGLSAITGFEAASGIGIEGFGAIISIYPNPTTGLVNISGLDGNTDITITDAKVQELKQTISKSDQLLTLDLSCCKTGVYFIKIQQPNETLFRKIVLY